MQKIIVILESPAPQPSAASFDMSGSKPAGRLHPQECMGKCSERCSKTQYKKACMFFCQKCCAKCLCVPPGTYGNKQFCPCYNNWKTKRGGPKCP
ncbi:hypothetical protein DM860_010590 [Cuscuta australis]|uniref:Gibberellin regulated protein n=1 Tax=Cuscuta australis TaxID=267555 RepID=A0A328E1L1_9ASTE|nr:hypothetical protein DM860_010590 [Cuscuta australis]